MSDLTIVFLSSFGGALAGTLFTALVLIPWLERRDGKR